jgi:Domain of unknown function (DUF4143)
LLETVYLVRTLPGWQPGLGNREVQAPKVHLGDSGLLAALLGADERRVASDDQISGKVYEIFVAMEVVRHLPWAETAARPYHYRDSARRRGGEIDLLLEDRAGRLVAIEAKARASEEAADFVLSRASGTPAMRTFKAAARVRIPLGASCLVRAISAGSAMDSGFSSLRRPAYYGPLQPATAPSRPLARGLMAVDQLRMS